MAIDERVRIGLSANALMKAAALVYGLPLAGLLSGALIGSVFSGAEIWVLLGGGLGFVLGITMLRIVSRHIDGDPRFQPRVL